MKKDGEYFLAFLDRNGIKILDIDNKLKDYDHNSASWAPKIKKATPCKLRLVVNNGKAL